MSANNGTRSAETPLVRRLLGISGRLDRQAKSRVFEARNSASEAWDRLESAFVHRVARALNALQIPTARDVHELNSRVESLQKAVVSLERRVAEQAPPQPKPARRRKAAARSGTGATAVAAGKTRARKKAGS